MTNQLAGLAMAMLVVGATLSIAPVASVAAEDSTDLVSVNTDDHRPSFAEEPLKAAGMAADVAVGKLLGLGVTDRIRDLRGDEPDPTAEAQDLQTFLNDNEGDFVRHTNSVIDEYNASVGNATYVLELEVTADETAETIYFVGQANGSEVTGYDVVNDTSKTVDRSRSMTSFEAEDLNEDVRDYHDEYVQTGDIPEIGYYVQLGARYGNISELTEDG